MEIKPYFSYKVRHLFQLVVIIFLLSISIILVLGCLEENVCSIPKKTTLSQIVDHVSLYNLFAVILTMNTMILLWTMLHFLVPTKIITKGQEWKFKWLTRIIFLAHFVASIGLVMIILLPVSTFGNTHTRVAQWTFGCLLAVCIGMCLRRIVCEHESKQLLVIQVLHILVMFGMVVGFWLTSTGWFEIALIYQIILFFAYTGHEYKNVNITVGERCHKQSLSKEQKYLLETHLPTKWLGTG
jgi:hypothetical protein